MQAETSISLRSRMQRDQNCLLRQLNHIDTERRLAMKQRNERIDAVKQQLQAGKCIDQ